MTWETSTFPCWTPLFLQLHTLKPGHLVINRNDITGTCKWTFIPPNMKYINGSEKESWCFPTERESLSMSTSSNLMPHHELGEVTSHKSQVTRGLDLQDSEQVSHDPGKHDAPMQHKAMVSGCSLVMFIHSAWCWITFCNRNTIISICMHAYRYMYRNVVTWHDTLVCCEMFVRKNGLVWNSAWNFGTPKCDGFIGSKPQNSLHFSGYTTFTTFLNRKSCKAHWKSLHPKLRTGHRLWHSSPRSARSWKIVRS